MKANISRRTFLQAAGISALSVGLAACGGGGGGGTPASSSSSSSGSSSGSASEPSSEVPSDFFSDKTIDVDGIKWKISPCGSTTYPECGLEGYDTTGKTPSGSITIPSIIDAYEVTSIGYRCFYENTLITNVVIPDTVNCISGEAFAYCTNLTSVNIPESVTSIYDRAFYQTSLQSVTIPSKTTSMGEEVFAENEALESVWIKGNIYRNYLSAGIFKNCTSLKTINLAGNLERLESGTFYGCTALTSVNIPQNITSIGTRTFEGCASLSEITFAGEVTSYGSDAFSKTALKSFKFADGIEEIPACIFSDCKNLESVILPDSVRDIGQGAFSGCTSLTSINLPSKIRNIGQDTFKDCVSLSEIELPENIKKIECRCFSGCKSLTSIVVPTAVKEIEQEAFASSGLQKIFIPATIQTISASAFLNCTGILKDVYYGGSEAAWKNLITEETNNLLASENYTCHYNSTPASMLSL